MPFLIRSFQVVAFIIFFSADLFGSLDSTYWVNVGVGLPQLTSVEFGFHPLQRWQFGISYGVIPGGGSGGGISPSYSLPSQNVTLSNGIHLTFNEPTITVSISSLAPFVRFFPGSTGFYLQTTLAMLRVRNTLTSDVYDVLGRKLIDAEYSGEVTVTQFFPTVSIGHVFNSELFFFSINMGVTIVANLEYDIRLQGKLPDSLGGASANESVLQGLDDRNRDAINQASQAFKDQVSFLPSIQLLFGMMF